MTFTNGLVDHRVPNFSDHSAMLARLGPTVPVLKRVGDYLQSERSGWKETDPVWTPVHDHTYFAYHGPGGIRVRFGARVAEITALCPYKAFATMPAQHAAHLPAFRSVAQVLGGTRLVLMPDDDSALVDAVKDDGASLDECIALLRKSWGEPHPRTEVATEDWEVYKIRKFPVWYVESLDGCA